MLEAVIDGGIELVLPTVVLDELTRVLRDKLGFDEDHANRVLELLERLASHRPDPSKRIARVTGDRADDTVLACAVETAVDVLVTGDRKHLLPLGEHEGVRLLTPQALLAELHAAG